MTNLIKLFLPPIILNILRKYSIHRLRKKTNYDPRRWWEGGKIVKCQSNHFKDFFHDFRCNKLLIASGLQTRCY